jgi:tetratricopeptide (TPR) repeat protein
MDALRKAEQQKRALAQENQPSAAIKQELSLEPIATPEQIAPETPDGNKNSQVGNTLPELPQHLEELDEQFMAHVPNPRAGGNTQSAAKPPPQTPAEPPAKPAPTGSRADTDIARARALFEAKQPAEKTNRNFAIAVGLSTLLAVAAIGGYFWWELQPKGGIVAVPTPSPASPAPQAATPAAPISQADLGSPAEPAPAAAPLPSQTRAAVTPAPTLAPVPPQREEEADEDPPVAAKRAVSPPPASPAPVQPQSPIRVSKAQLKTDPLLEQAWQAFNRGEGDLARAAWHKVLQADPHNADALHGLGTLARQRGQLETAAAYYLRALEGNPRDALAYATLLALTPPSDARLAESRLKGMLAEQPDSPHLNFALGNLQARESRWSDAQQAYFKAHAADPANPDYLFNLAVSLDQLHKPQLAARYYNQAVEAAAKQPASFDAGQVAARLKQLQSGGH